MTAQQDEPLSEREIQILRLVAAGKTNQRIARDLFISPNTVKVHLRNVYSKLGVESRTEAALFAVRQGWVQMEGITLDNHVDETGPVEEVRLTRLSAGRRIAFIVTALALLLLVILPLLGRAYPTGTTFMADHLSEVRVLGPRQDADRWEARAQMPTPRARFAQTTYGRLIFVIAGATASGPTSELEVYDPTADSWQRKAGKPSAVSNIGAVVLDGSIYVPGGYDSTGAVTTTVEAYSPLTDSWTTSAPLPHPLCAYAIAAYQGHLYLFGGWDGKVLVDTVYRYDPSSLEWDLLSPLSSPRAFAAAAVVDDTIYVVGGYDGQQESAACESYTPSREGTDETPWQVCAPLNQARGGLALTSVGTVVYAIGGGWEDELAFNERYDVQTNAWYTFESPIIAQWRTLGTSVVDMPQGTMIYAIGGWSGDYLSTNQQYQAIFRVHIPTLGE
jgi:DNA-binding CsgD family transcriptional regulator